MARSSTTYSQKWRSSKTKVIRVPEHLADSLLQLAERLDTLDSFCIKEDGGILTLEPLTPPKKIRYSSARPVNVASVPQRSPFRYPGGKTWFIPYVRDWLNSKTEKPKYLVEPFAGGGIVSLTAGFESLAEHVVFSEIDPHVASVWKCVLNGKADWLAQSILEFDLTVETVKTELAKIPKSTHQRAFQTILRNRVQRGGIMAPGAGLVKAGENGKGIRSRWYPETLARRIHEISAMQNRFTFLERDAFETTERFGENEDAVFYFDPPYTKAGKRLYNAWDIDHQRLFDIASKIKGDFLMSYDLTDEIMEFARRYKFQTREIAMKNTHHAKKTEVLIGRDLDWLS